MVNSLQSVCCLSFLFLIFSPLPFFSKAKLPFRKHDLNVSSVYFTNDEAKLKSIFCAFMIYLAA